MIPAIPMLVFLVVITAIVIAMVSRFREHELRLEALQDPSRVKRRMVRWGLGLIGVILAVAAALSLGQRAIFLVAPLAISGYVAGLMLGELMMPSRQFGPVRTGSLHRRSFARYLKSKWLWAWRGGASTAAIALVAAGLAGGADGRSLTLACVDDTLSSAAPWPGWSYGGPALAALLLGALLVELSMQRIVERPRPDPTLLGVDADEANRAASLKRVVAAGMAIAMVPLAGVCLSAAMIYSFICSSSGTLAWTGPLAAALAILGLAAGIGAIAGLAALIRIAETGGAAPPAKQA